MIDWLLAVIRFSSPLFLLLLVPFVFLFWIKRYRMRVLAPRLLYLRLHGVRSTRFVAYAEHILWGAVVALIVLTLVSPTLPSFETVVLDKTVECDRDIVVALDISGSMRGPFRKESDSEEVLNKFDVAVDALHAFAQGRPSDCFSTILFSGSGGMSYPEKGHGYAFLLNSRIRDADELILSLTEGLDDSFSSLRQFSQGTQISEGMEAASSFLQDKATSNTHVVLLISDLGNETEDNALAIELLENLRKRDVALYVFGVEVAERSDFYEELIAGFQEPDMYYFPVGVGDDFKEAFSTIDMLEPSAMPKTHTEVVVVRRINTVFLWGAIAICFIWISLKQLRREIP